MMMTRMMTTARRTSALLTRSSRAPLFSSSSPLLFSTSAQQHEADPPGGTVYSPQQVDDMTLVQWAEAFKREAVDVTAMMDPDDTSPLQSSQRLRRLVQGGLLRHSDLARRPDRFFLAHRLLAEHAWRLGPGFWIRFTVHYNLCMGSVLGLGSDEQVQLLEDFQDKGDLGCFSLTEKFAGVNSGLVVNTTATYDPSSSTFTLHTPNEGAKKNWISQGFVADKTVVVADMLIEGKSYGPHAFLMDMRREQGGDLVPGVTVGDMGLKTVGNDLDNAWVNFDQVVLPKSALLNRYADIEDAAAGEGGGDGSVQYVQKVKGMPVFHMIGQRLFTGRVAVAQAALGFRKGIFAAAKQYTDQKVCWSPLPGEQLSLSSLPQLQHLYGEALKPVQRVERFVQLCEEDLSACLQLEQLPSVQLVEAIAVAKVKAVEESIAVTHQLRNEVGSYALMKDSGFAQTDFLQCCKFAEGDSRILMQKMARDRMRMYEKGLKQKQAGPEEGQEEEARLCAALHEAMDRDVETGTCAHKHAAWNHRWREVYALSEAVMERVMVEFMAGRED